MVTQAMMQWEEDFSWWINNTIPGMIVGSLLIGLIVSGPAILLACFLHYASKD